MIDITFCGDWAGNSYIDSGCPGTCSDRIMNPKNFVVKYHTVYPFQYTEPDPFVECILDTQFPPGLSESTNFTRLDYSSEYKPGN